MSSRSAARTSAVVVLLLVGATASPAQVDPFYLDLEREASSASLRGDLVGAAKMLRVACFGMLDEPPRLAACTVRLATAQAAVKDLEGFRASFLRLSTVEERFQGLTGSGLSAEELGAFARLASARMSATEIALLPAVADLIAAERAAATAATEPKPSGAKEKSRRRRTEKPAEVPIPAEVVTPEVEPAVAPPPESPAEEPSAAPGKGGAAELDSSAPGELSADPSNADQDRLDETRHKLTQRPDRSVIEAELEAVRAIADRNADDAAAARLAGDLAYLLGLWPVCADYFQRAGDPGPDQPLGRFYMAVCLFEIGQTEQAALLIAPSADRLKRSPFVDAYLSRILGRPGPT